MKSTKYWKNRRQLDFGALCLFGCGLLGSAAHAEVRLSKDWGASIYPDGRLIPKELLDSHKVEQASKAASFARIAVAKDSAIDGQPEFGLGFKLYMGDELFYVEQPRFMQKTRPDEICHIKNFVNRPTYQCEEGQRYTVSCHLGVFDKGFKEVGWHTVQIKESSPVYCNADVALGVFDKSHDDLLMTVQYFPVDRAVASKISQIGSGWVRMTVRLKLRRAEDGRIHIEQDDACLGNPNRIDTISDARRTLRQCEIKAMTNVLRVP